MTTSIPNPTTFVLPVSRELRKVAEVLYYDVTLSSDNRSATIGAFNTKNEEISTIEVEQLNHGKFKIFIKRDENHVSINFTIAQDVSKLEGDIDEQQFYIDIYAGSVSKVPLTDDQSKVLQAWRGSDDSFIDLGEVITVRSEGGCVLTALGVGFAVFACSEGVIAGCAGALYGGAYLVDHCI
jgi:hypothetical protein